MIAAEKAQALQEFLASLPETLAARLAKAVEVDRLAGGTRLPHDLILAGLRPVLRRVPMPERTATPLRLFTQPFEDLLTSEPRKDKQKGAISRDSIQPVWNWLSQKLAPQELARYALAVKTAVLGYHAEEASAQAREFWRTASDALRGALDTDARKKAARGVLGGDAFVQDAAEIALLLSAASELCEVQALLPKPWPALADEQLWKLREIYDRLIAGNPDAAAYVAVLAMNRLEKPWEALKLPMLITRKSGDTLISSTDMGLVGELIFGAIERHAAAIRASKPQLAFDADELVMHLTEFATLSGGIVKEMEIRRDGKWGQRLLKDRAAIAEVMEGFMARAPREVLAALPTHKTGSYAGGPRAPDISRAPDPEKTLRALTYARLVVGCRSVASSASIAASWKDATDEISVALKSYGDDIVRELRAAEGDRKSFAEQYFSVAVELVAIVFSAEEAEFLRRRGRAALGQSPAVAAA
ncbi:MAG TPA: hypothetical protein VMH86_03355 [Rhizomicrobium sp.]|nr:hypothetical protein [Rhizomicrobium sp.]